MTQPFHQATTVSWSVDRGSSTMDLLTLDNMTFSGDPRCIIPDTRHHDITYDACFQILNRGSEPNKLGPGHRKCAGQVSWILNGHWPLGQCWHLTFISPLVIIRDAGKYICTLETFPKQSLMVYLQVNGEFLSKHFSRQKKILQQFSKKYLNKRFSSSNSM